MINIIKYTLILLFFIIYFLLVPIIQIYYSYLFNLQLFFAIKGVILIIILINIVKIIFRKDLIKNYLNNIICYNSIYIGILLYDTIMLWRDFNLQNIFISFSIIYSFINIIIFFLFFKWYKYFSLLLIFHLIEILYINIELNISIIKILCSILNYNKKDISI